MPESAVLAVRDLVVKRGKRVVLTVPELEIRQGERLAVVGPNGAGKSTLLEVLALLREPDAGRVFFGGAEVRWRHAELVRLRRRLAVVFQRPLLLEGTLLENVMLGERLRGTLVREASEAARLWLERLGVAHLAARRSGQVSVGEAQRASIARALVSGPEVLLLDEPFTSLDSVSRFALVETLEGVLQSQRCAVVLVTHEWREVRRLAQRVVVLFGGQVAQSGTLEEIERNPATPQVAALLDAAA